MIDRVPHLSVEDFRREYLDRQRPVVFGGAIEGWTARTRWTPQYLKDTWGDTHIDYRGITGSLREVIDRAAASRPERPEPYLKNLDIASHLPGMLADIAPRLPHANPNWFDSPLVPGAIRDTGTRYELFIGGNGSFIPRLHYDEFAVNNFISQIYGTKEFWFYPPDAGRHLYPGVDNPYLSQVDDPRAPDPARFPLFNTVEPFKLLVRPGETVYVAPGWWHWTQMPELSISVGCNCANRSNWSRFTHEFTTAFGRRSRPKWIAMRAYLSAYGALRSLAG